MTIKTVFFDVGYTLIHPKPSWSELFVAVCARQGIKLTSADVELARKRLRENRTASGSAPQPSSRGYSLTYSASCAYWSEYYRLLFDQLELSVTREVIAKLYQTMILPSENYELYTDVTQSLERLQACGYTLGIISNWEPNLREILDFLEISRYFDLIIVSSDVGIEKPDLQIFGIALEKVGGQKCESAYIGDSLSNDVTAAQAVGMIGILLDRTDELQTYRGFRITDLRQLKAALDHADTSTSSVISR